MSLSNSGIDPSAGTEPTPAPPRMSPPPPPPAFQPAPVRPLPTRSADGAPPVAVPSPPNSLAGTKKLAAVVPSRSVGTVQPKQPQSGVGSATRGILWRGELAIEAEKVAGEGSVAEQGRELSVEKAAPPWLISLVIHLILLLVLALIVSPAGQRLTTVVLEMGQSPDQGDDLESFELSPSDPNIEDALEMESVDVAEAIVEMPQELFSPKSLIESLESVQPEIASVSIPVGGMMSGRLGTSKEALLAAYGGTGQTEEAVQMGLRWLAQQQEPSGSWSLRGKYTDGSFSENRIAATAMALLAFQGNGNTHLTGPYKDQVEKGVRWLVKEQDRAGYFCKNLPRHEKMYAQAQASIVICELYAMTKDSWLREPAQRALNFAAESQSNLGGWRYEPRQDADTSVTGWYVMTLQSGRAAELDYKEEALRKVSYYLDSVQHAEGAAYSYQAGGGPSPAMTAEGMLCRQYLGWKRSDPIMANCVNALVEQKNFNIDDQDTYYWYYATQVLHHYGGSPWRAWNEKMRVQLPAAQVTTGKEKGSWAPQGDRWGGQAGRLYTTCMSIFCLEVYYRHMPLYAIDVDEHLGG